MWRENETKSKQTADINCEPEHKSPDHQIKKIDKSWNQMAWIFFNFLAHFAGKYVDKQNKKYYM